MTTCQNCHRVIGDLETAYHWQGYIICMNCNVAIASAQAPPTPDPSPADPLDELAAARSAPKRSYYRPPRVATPKTPWSKFSQSGIALMLVSLPFMCVPPVGIVLFIVGLILFILGLFF